MKELLEMFHLQGFIELFKFDTRKKKLNKAKMGPVNIQSLVEISDVISGVEPMD